MNIYVGNMNFNLGNEDLFNLFSQFGEVSSAKIINDKETGRSKGFGFVEMENAEDALKAIASLNESEVQGRKLIVNEARPQEKSGGGGVDLRKEVSAAAVAAATIKVAAVEAVTGVTETAAAVEVVTVSMNIDIKLFS